MITTSLSTHLVQAGTVPKKFLRPLGWTEQARQEIKISEVDCIAQRILQRFERMIVIIWHNM